MVFNKKTLKPEKEEIIETPKVASDVKVCACGGPIAVELGQSDVCKKHIRVG